MKPAVARSRAISGHKPGSGGDNTVAYPARKQHLAIRATVTKMLKDQGKDVTAESIMAAAGFKTMKSLMAVATWEADRSTLASLRPLSNACGAASGVNGKTDGWATGRYLASALVTWIEEIKTAAKS